MNKFSISSAALLTAVIFSATTTVKAAMPHYLVKERMSLGAPTKWDFTDIDQIRHRLYLSRGDHVQVLQLPSGKPIGEIPNTAGVHGIAFAQDLNLGFTSNGASNSVTVFDLETMKIKQEIKIPGINPDVILYEPLSHKLFTFNGKSHDVSVIDARTLAVVATIEATGRPEFAVSDGAGKIFFNIEDNAGINVIDVASNSIVERWVLKGCDEPSGLAIDAKRARLFSTCQNKVMAVTDARTGERVANVGIGEHPDAVVYDADTQRIFTSNGGGGGTLTIIHQNDSDHYTVAENVATEKGAKTMAFDNVSKTVYLPTVVNSNFSVLVVGPK
jgi:YVTN family beta-propeller protein